MSNEITSREDMKRELIIEYVYKGIKYSSEHPIVVFGICLSGMIITTCIMIENKKGEM